MHCGSQALCWRINIKDNNYMILYDGGGVDYSFYKLNLICAILYGSTGLFRLKFNSFSSEYYIVPWNESNLLNLR